jgi:hypothetical protein
MRKDHVQRSPGVEEFRLTIIENFSFSPETFSDARDSRKYSRLQNRALASVLFKVKEGVIVVFEEHTGRQADSCFFP